MHHSASAPDAGMFGADVDEEEGFLVILDQKRSFRKKSRAMRDKYDELEDELFDRRRPPLLRTLGGEIVQGVYPTSSSKWLGVPPRFGEVAEQKYVGAGANALSKWISTDKIQRLKSEASIYDQPLRAYVKIDDSINVKEMTGSHFRFFSNPLNEEIANQDKDLALEDGSNQLALRDDYEGEEEEEMEEYDEEEEESDAALPSNAFTSALGRREEVDQEEKDAKSFAAMDAIFQRHCAKLANKLQRDCAKRNQKTEANWREGQSIRPATLRFRR